MPPHDTTGELLAAATLAGTLLERHAEANVRKMIYLGCYSWRETSVQAVERSLEERGLPDSAFQRFATAAARPWGSDAAPPAGRQSTQRTCYFYRSPGFLSRYKGGPLPAETRRYYLALRASQASWFLGAAASALDEVLPSYAMKCLATPASYRRADAAVIYVPDTDAAVALDALQAAIAAASVRLRPLTPLGTCPIAPGLAWADSLRDESAQELSFGLWLADLIVEAAACAREADDAAANLAEYCMRRGRTLESVYQRGAS